ncbi:ParB/Srx family N-terminal domain-containing protein [Austwickia chelonae]|uniref:ParB/Srx family N-terminal domain-containing protein n=1 Tax=Austwickia chelonae TaxID=100225 RepID=UPI000E232087|nr:ParB/Srx family N-terminal domain-containing protein [Austwickia chelonae]
MPHPVRHPRRTAVVISAIAVVVGTVSVFVVATSELATGRSPLASGQRLAQCRLGGRQPGTPPHLCAREGEIIEIRLGDLTPTQPTVGHDAVHYRLGRYTAGKDQVNRRFTDWCRSSGLLGAIAADAGSKLSDPSTFTCELRPGEETEESRSRMKTVVIGRGGRPYLTDGHHTFTAFHTMPDGGPDMRVRVRVMANLGGLGEKDFWERMRTERWVWLRDATGKEIPPDTLPGDLSLKSFGDDRYRSLAYFTRGIGHRPRKVPFQEFHWATWLRESGKVDLTGWQSDDPASYLKAVQTAAKAQINVPRRTVVHDGMTAGQLGLRTKLGEKTLARLGKPLSDKTPGKLAYITEGRRFAATR